MVYMDFYIMYMNRCYLERETLSSASIYKKCIGMDFMQIRKYNYEWLVKNESMENRDWQYHGNVYIYYVHHWCGAATTVGRVGHLQKWGDLMA